VRLLVRAAGLRAAVALLAPRWGPGASGFEEDVDVLAGEAGYEDLASAVERAYPAAFSDARAQAGWERALLGLDPEFLAMRDDLLRDARSPDYSRRRDAFEEAVRGDAADTPAFLFRFSRDPSILLRRDAVGLAGRVGVAAVARAALSDPAWAVRQEACAALLAARDVGAVPLVVRLLERPDPDPRVRAAAAHALLGLAPADERVARVLVAQVRGSDDALADDVGARLTLLDAAVAARALAGALAEEASRPPEAARRAVLFRLFLAYRRVTGRDPGYDPSMPPERVRAIVAALPERAR
jgi:hypothetical protein